MLMFSFSMGFGLGLLMLLFAHSSWNMRGVYDKSIMRNALHMVNDSKDTKAP